MGAYHKELSEAARAAREGLAATGWDPKIVWRDRVQLPRLARDPGISGAADGAALPGQPWDAYRVWRQRVLEAQPLTDPSCPMPVPAWVAR